MLRLIKYFFLFCIILCVLLAAAVGGGLYYLVVVEPGPEIRQENIEAILGRESPVLYNDGTTVLGVLFQDYHRQYLSYDQIPKQFVQALIAAEDNSFFHHYGVDPAGILRAMIANIRAGRVVQGGSTLTQQTAKNLFKREGRSYRAKLKELLYALRLEYHYPKEKILEFYINQFYVSGNGHGLGVAARYYFDKDPSELSLLECAFIAGSVKRPNYYNPFTKKNRKQEALARRRADERADYVLRNMLKEKYITPEQYEAAVGSDIVFNQGKMAYALNTIMDMVKEGLSSDLITDALEEHGISNVSTSGIRVITSIDHDLQKKTLLALRSHLSYLQVRLHGYDRTEVQKRYARHEPEGRKELAVGDFLFGTLQSIRHSDKGSIELVVSFGDSLPSGILDQQGMESLLDAWVRHEKNRWATVKIKTDLPKFLTRFQEGDRIFVRVREIGLDETPVLELACYPELEGAALIMRQGAVHAMAGGFENHFFNRAVDAKRLMGSTFKPFLFAAAIQLGWNPVDLLDNRRNVFVFMDRPYFPRPDHHSPFDHVSMSWAGVKSENVAAVWLLYHLTDHLTPPRIRELASSLGMAPGNSEGGQESYRVFKARIRDRYGIRVDRKALERAAYELAVKSLEADFLFEDRGRAYRLLQALPYGLHYDRYRQDLEKELAEGKVKARNRKEWELRLKLLERSYLGLEPLLGPAGEYRQYFKQLLEKERSFIPLFNQVRVSHPSRGQLVEDEEGNLILTLRNELPETWLPVSDDEVLARMRDLDREGFERFWDSLLLEGAVCVCSYEAVQAQMDVELKKLTTADPYSMEVLSTIRDYRVMLGLQYLIQLGRNCGIDSTLEPVLSFPLGSNVVSLIEMLRMYETLLSGNRYEAGTQMEPADNRISGTGEQRDGIAVINRIETRDGKVIYSRNVNPVKVVDKKTSSAIASILQNVVRHGTGRYAHEHVRLHSIDPDREKELADLDLPVPLLGKTGTANRYRNASFVGYVPVPDRNGEAVMTLEGGYTVGAYVGYDKNMPMISGTTRITGSSGGLPVWSEMAAALLRKEKAGDRFDPVDLSFNGLGLQYPETGQLFVPVAPDQGGVVLEGRGGRRTRIAPEIPVILTYGPVGAEGRFEPARFFRPFWKNLEEGGGGQSLKE